MSEPTEARVREIIINELGVEPEKVTDDASFVVSAVEKTAAEARERAELKRLVLASAEAAEARETEAGKNTLTSTGEDRKKFTVFSSATFSRVGRLGGRGARGFGSGDKRG